MISNVSDLLEILATNPGIVVVKLGAEWCGPCRKCAPVVHRWFSVMPPNVLTIEVDVDESADFYMFMKNKKMLKGIPVIYCYAQGNITYLPDEIVMGSDETEINGFFDRCLSRIQY